MMNKRIKIIAVLLLIILVICLPSIYAYMIRLADTPNQTDFVIGDTTCVINEVWKDNTKSSVKIDNKGNVDVYVRVKVLIYWEDTKSAPIGTDLYNDKNHALPVLNYNSADWIHDPINDIYYCKKPIKVGESSPEFLKGSLILKNYVVDELYSYNQVAEIHCESIQALPIDLDATDNVITNPATESWGVTINSDGVITAIN